MEERRFAEAGLTEEDGEGLALDAARELTGLVVAAVEEGALALGEGAEAGPGVGRIDRGGGWIADCRLAIADG